LRHSLQHPKIGTENGAELDTVTFK